MAIAAKDKNSDRILSEQNLCYILNSLDEGIHIVDRDGKTIFYNQKVSEIDGLDPEEVLGRNIFEAYPSLTLETSTLMCTLKSGQSIYNKQQTFINSRGKKITTINRTIPLKLASGEIGALEISRDITQLEELVDNLQLLRSNLVKTQPSALASKSSCLNNNTSYSFKDIIGESPLFKEVIQDALRAAGSDSSVLLVGETGTGKELFAQGIHNASKRRDHLFVAQNCAALPKDLLEGLLFGTAKGGFTGAKDCPGLFEQADRGTILLDEINSMNPALQAKLLRVLQENRIRRVGGQKELVVDVRVIATMNMPPDQAFKENKLREDLFYRLSVVYLELPPLRERTADISILLDYFVQLYNKKFSREIKGIDRELEEVFLLYDWPGNVRELQHVIESGFNLLQQEEALSYAQLPLYIKERLKNKQLTGDGIELTRPDQELPTLEQVLTEIELKLIKTALARSGGNISAAARLLNISRQSLQYKIKKHSR